jgi:hypothetical protein
MPPPRAPTLTNGNGDGKGCPLGNNSPPHYAPYSTFASTTGLITMRTTTPPAAFSPPNPSATVDRDDGESTYEHDDGDGGGIGGDDYYSNGDDAHPPPGYRGGGETRGERRQPWDDDDAAAVLPRGEGGRHHRDGGGGGGPSFEMVPGDEFDYDGDDPYVDDDDDDDDSDDGVGRARRQRYRPRLPAGPSHPAGGGGGGDDYSTSGTWLPRGAYRYLHPPDVPRAVQLFRAENVAVPACYLLVGLLQGLSGPFANVYPLDIGASEAQQATISSLKSLPASFKLIFGFASDNVPLCGYRRKSYMLLGWATASASMVALLAFSDLSADAAARQHGGGGGDDDARPPPAEAAGGGPPSLPFLSACLLFFGIGFWFADVMGDSIVAEKAKLEPPESRGQLQSTCYACRFFGLMVAAPVGTAMYSRSGPRALVSLMAALPACIVPLVLALGERRDAPVAPAWDQCREIWGTVCSRAVWQPMGFVYLYNVLQVGNAAWRQFLKTVLGFTSDQLNALLIAAYVLLWLGIMAYKRFFIHWSWRTVYVLTTLLNGLFSSLQILLIRGRTFGLSPFLFALGDDAMADFIAGIQFLPTTIMMVHLCPTGSEGASYAMFTTVNNSAGNLAGAFSTLLLGAWDVSKEAMERGDLRGMINLTWLTTAMQVSGLLFVGLLPRTKQDLADLHADPMSGSRIGGFVFLLVTFSSVLYSLVVGVLNIVRPGWAGES